MFSNMVKLVLFALILHTNVVYARSIHSYYYGYRICQDTAHFSCYITKSSDRWERLFPNEDQMEFEKKLNHINIHLEPGMVLAIPRSSNIELLDYSPFSQQISPPGERIIIVSLSREAWAAYSEQGTLVRWGPVSSARGYCPDIGHGCHTPHGDFSIYEKQGRGCFSTKFPVGRGGAPMPYCMFFHGGFALHGSYELPGYNASHGCIRMFIDDAEWLNEEFTDIGTRVYVAE